jgi:hypothetical protein
MYGYDHAPDVSSFMKSHGKRARRKVAVLIWIVIGLALAAAVGWLVWQNNAEKNSDPAITTSEIVPRTEWQPTPELGYTFSVPEPWEVTANDQLLWQARQHQEEITRLMEMTLVSDEQRMSTGSALTIAGRAGIQTSEQSTLFDGTLELAELKYLAQVQVGTGQSLNLAYLVRADVGYMTEERISEIRTEFENFVASIKAK